jgi:hypothetical protein
VHCVRTCAPSGVGERREDVPGNNILVLPAELVSESTNGAVLAAGLKTEDTESLGNDHALLVVVRRRNTIKGLEALESSGTAGRLVRDHTADGSPEHLGGSTVMPGTWIRVSARSNEREPLAVCGSGGLVDLWYTYHHGKRCNASACAGKPGT